VMKNRSLFILLFVSFILFLVGISIQVLNLKSERRIFWIVAIVCVPMIGNLIYIIVHDALTRKQILKTDV